MRERVVFAELKDHHVSLRPEQEKWLQALRDAGAEAYVWAPGDWEDVQRVLAKPPRS